MRHQVLALILLLLHSYLPTPLDAGWQASSGRIAFVLVEAEATFIATVDPDGGNLRRVMLCMSICRHPVWSLDGQRLGFVDGNALVTVEINSGEADRFLVDLGTYDYNVRPAWSANLQFVVHPARVNMQGVLRLTDLMSHRTEEIEGLPGTPAFPTWVDNDMGFIFSAAGNIYHYDMKHQHMTALTDSDQPYDLPVPAPDGSQILIRRIAQDEPGLALFDRETGKINFVTSGIVDSPNWSPDGRYIAFNLWDNGQWSLQLLTVKTGDLTILANNTTAGSTLDWSPDSASIAYTGLSDEEARFSGLYRVDISGNEQIQLVELINRAGSPATGLSWQHERIIP